MLLSFYVLSIILVNLVCWYTLWNEFSRKTYKWNRVITSALAYVVTINMFYDFEDKILHNNTMFFYVKIALMSFYFFVAYQAYNNKRVFSGNSKL